jgi:hypothetical protein
VKAGNRPGEATTDKVAAFGRHFTFDVPRALHGRKLLGVLESESIRRS